MVTKTLVRVSDGAIISTVAVTAPNDENRNNHQPPKKKDDGSDDKKIAAKETAVTHHNVSAANNTVEVDNMSTTHVTQTKDEKKSTATGTRRSSRQKRPVVFNDDVDEEDADSNKTKRRRKQGKVDLKGVPMQVPILKHDGKKGAFSSKFVGVNWNKPSKKWMARIWIDGKDRYIGCYDNEEDAAIDYARAVFSYNGGSDGIDRLKAKQRVMASLEKIDLTDVPMQLPIMKPNGKGRSTSKYLGVSWLAATKKWTAQITIDRKQRRIGYYKNEEDAAADYARAVFKYKGGNAEVKSQDESRQPLNLIQVPAIPPAGYDPIKGGPISALQVTEYEI